LYNLADDISETNNLAEAEPERFAELQSALNAWDAQMVAPLWVRESFAGEGQQQAGGQGVNVERRFRRLDADGDGRISREEAGGRRWFDRADADGDGFVTREEARDLQGGR